MSLPDEGQYQGCSLAEALMPEVEGGKSPHVLLKFNAADGIVAFVYLYLTDKAYAFTTEKLERLGFNGNFEAMEFSNASDVALNCRHEVYENKTRAKWDVVGGMPKPAAPDVIRNFNARWKAEHKTTPRPAGRPAAPPPPAKPAGAPARPAPAKPAAEDAKATTKDEAWDRWGKSLGNPNSNEFYTAIETIEKMSKKQEADFGPAEWERVAKAGELLSAAHAQANEIQEDDIPF